MSRLRCWSVTTVAEERFAKLVHAIEQGLSEYILGCSYVTNCSDAAQWAGCNVAYLVNASDRGYFEWHTYCAIFWIT